MPTVILIMLVPAGENSPTIAWTAFERPLLLWTFMKVVMPELPEHNFQNVFHGHDRENPSPQR